MKKTKKELNKSAVHNPFEGRNPDEVWAEIRRNKGPQVSREEAMRAMKALAKQKKG